MQTFSPDLLRFDSGKPFTFLSSKIKILTAFLFLILQEIELFDKNSVNTPVMRK
jgi:hypothetical protein